ncbi:MAG TPA: hypothetical protein VG225_12515 [Terracidiphilus sp.]|jgi:hypothetical protein|nr:hypothetical protein [Terracidiphilus sp.]
MAGTIPVAGDMKVENLAATLTTEEQLKFERLTVLEVDPNKVGNLATFENEPKRKGALAIVARGVNSPGIKILSPTVFISGTKTDVDVYRLSSS